MKKIDEVINYLSEEIKLDEMISKKREKICKTINYIEHLLALHSNFTSCVSICGFASLVGVSFGVSGVLWKIFVLIIVTKN